MALGKLTMWETSQGTGPVSSLRFGRTLNYRGDIVATEIHLQATVHDMLKAIYRGRTARNNEKWPLGADGAC